MFLVKDSKPASSTFVCTVYANDAEPLALLKKFGERLKAGKRSKEIPVLVLKPPDSYTL